MGKRVGGRGWNAPAKKSRENHESKPLIRVAAGSIGPTNADRWVSMETRICPLGPYVPASSRLSVVGVSATTKSRGTNEREERASRECRPSVSLCYARKRRSEEKECRGRNKARGLLQNERERNRIARGNLFCIFIARVQRWCGEMVESRAETGRFIPRLKISNGTSRSFRTIFSYRLLCRVNKFFSVMIGLRLVFDI